MALQIATCLNLAEQARKDTSLLSNHLGTVDRMLCDKLADDRKLLNAIGGDIDHQSMADELRSEISAIEYALTVYAA